MPTELYYEDASMSLHAAVSAAAALGTEGTKFLDTVRYIHKLMMTEKEKLAATYDRAPKKFGGGGGGGGFAKKWEDTTIVCEVCGTGHMRRNMQYQAEGVSADGSVKSNPNGPWMKCSNQTWNNATRKPEGCPNTVWDREVVQAQQFEPAGAAVQPVPRDDYGPDDAPF